MTGRAQSAGTTSWVLLPPISVSTLVLRAVVAILAAKVNRLENA